MVSPASPESFTNCLPQRQTLISQTALLLQESIQQGNWRDKLPAERALCAKYQVSRNTLRAALQRLQSDQVVRSVHGSGNYILTTPAKKTAAPRSRDVALLSPEPLECLRPSQTLWIDELRAMLSERGVHLRVFHGRQWFRNQPGRALQRLVSDNPHSCWILALSNAATQQWFSDNHIHCVVAGSIHAGLDLSSCDIDHRAMCRHAVGTFLGLGHRKLALVISKSQLAGDLESEAGFLEGTKQNEHRGAETIFCRHDGTAEGVCQGLRSLMARPVPPTGILVANAYNCLTVITALMQLGLRVPTDVSVISRDDERFLSYVIPEPARYTTDPHVIANSLLRMVLSSERDRRRNRARAHRRRRVCLRR